jgi:hypothetical protein
MTESILLLVLQLRFLLLYELAGAGIVICVFDSPIRPVDHLPPAGKAFLVVSGGFIFFRNKKKSQE